MSLTALLHLRRRHLTEQWFRQHFGGFLYVHYKYKYYLWEVVMMIQTLL